MGVCQRIYDKQAEEFCRICGGHTYKNSYGAIAVIVSEYDFKNFFISSLDRNGISFILKKKTKLEKHTFKRENRRLTQNNAVTPKGKIGPNKCVELLDSEGEKLCIVLLKNGPSIKQTIETTGETIEVPIKNLGKYTIVTEKSEMYQALIKKSSGDIISCGGDEYRINNIFVDETVLVNKS